MQFKPELYPYHAVCLKNQTQQGANFSLLLDRCNHMLFEEEQSMEYTSSGSDGGDGGRRRRREDFYKENNFFTIFAVSSGPVTLWPVTRGSE